METAHALPCGFHRFVCPASHGRLRQFDGGIRAEVPRCDRDWRRAGSACRDGASDDVVIVGVAGDEAWGGDGCDAQREGRVAVEQRAGIEATAVLVA